MSALGILQLLAGCFGLVAGVLVYLWPRFGAGNHWLGIYLISSAVAAAALSFEKLVPGISPNFHLPLTFFLLNLTVSPAFLFSLTGIREENQAASRRWRFPGKSVASIGVILTACGILSLGFVLGTPLQSLLGAPVIPAEDGTIAIGKLGYLTSFFMLLSSIFILANFEQTLRSAQEPALWSIKFLLIGMGVQIAFIFYLSSKVILTSQLPRHTLEAFPFLLAPANLLILLSWNRARDRVSIVVSQGFVFSSMTLVAVGVYLIGVSLASLKLGSLLTSEVEVEVPVIMASLILLSIVLASTKIRHKARRWIRLNIFSGKYDYRKYWLEAAEHIRASGPTGSIATELTRLVHESLDAVNVSVWLKVKDKDSVKAVLKARYGSQGIESGEEIPEVLGAIQALAGPTSLKDLVERNSFGEERGRFNHLIALLKLSESVLCVPLRSGGHALGILAVGSNRSDYPFESEDGEFLKVLAEHASSELHMSELLNSQIEAKEAEAFRSFSTFLLHDLKNYSTTLSLLAGNASRHQGNPAFQQDAFHSIADIARKMKRLCNSLGSFSAQLARNRRPADLNEMVRRAAQNLPGDAGERLELQLQPLPCAHLDEEEVARVLANLIINALEASQQDGRIQLKTAAVGGNVELEVIDRGKGIPREFLEKELFLPFHTTKSDGLGIGLFQSRKIIEAHGGSIQIDSEEGKGTTVRVRFPASQEAAGG